MKKKNPLLFRFSTLMFLLSTVLCFGDRIKLQLEKKDGQWLVADGVRLSEKDSEIFLHLGESVIELRLKKDDVIVDVIANKEVSFLGLRISSGGNISNKARLVIFDVKKGHLKDLILDGKLTVQKVLSLSKNGNFLGVVIEEKKTVAHPKFDELILSRFVVIDGKRGVVIDDKIDNWREFRSEGGSRD